jgi:AbrB family looped-hinge helix DNA binding protein
MNTTGKIQNKGQVTIPTAVRRQAGLSKGDLVNFTFRRGQIVITPRVIIDRSKFPTADDEYTPAQRRAINRGIAKSEKEYKQGRFFGPFDKHEDFIAALHKEAGTTPADPTKRPRQ